MKGKSSQAEHKLVYLWENVKLCCTIKVEPHENGRSQVLGQGAGRGRVKQHSPRKGQTVLWEGLVDTMETSPKFSSLNFSISHVSIFILCKMEVNSSAYKL